MTACTACPAGYSCSTTNAAPVPCDAGEYSTGGDTFCDPCPEGQYCLNPAMPPANCDDGYYSAAVSSLLVVYMVFKYVTLTSLYIAH